jgi:hypothetical protein
MSTQPTPAQTLQAERLKFPGMLPREIIIWRNWCKLHEAEYDRFDYNTRIGSGHDPGPSWPDEIRRMAVANTQLRIDAVAWKGDTPTLLEVKDRAGASAVGQILTYEAVWLQDFPQGPPPLLIMVTNRLQNNIMPLVKKANIRLDLVLADFSELRPKPFVPGY